MLRYLKDRLNTLRVSGFLFVCFPYICFEMHVRVCLLFSVFVVCRVTMKLCVLLVVVRVFVRLFTINTCVLECAL